MVSVSLFLFMGEGSGILLLYLLPVTNMFGHKVEFKTVHNVEPTNKYVSMCVDLQKI